MFLARRSLGIAYTAPLTRRLSSRASSVLGALDIPTTPTELPGVYDGEWKGSGDILQSVCPTTGEVLAHVKSASPAELHAALERTREAYVHFRSIPAPRRGEIIRQIREALAAKREELGALVSLEMGKIRTEGVGEVQEFVDVCDYAVGLSRMLNGRVINSERPGHTILEVPNPLGVLGVLSAFNFPVAVYGWNLSISMAAGNATIWKPSPTTPLCSIAVTRIVSGVLEKNNIPGAVAGLVTGGKDVGEALVQSRDVDMVSFTGSEHVGRIVGKNVQSRFGKVLLELGGNNAAIVMPDADLSLAVPAVFFGSLYGALKPGDPLDARTLLGPLHTRAAVDAYDYAIAELKAAGSQILVGGGNFVRPTIAVPAAADGALWATERFAPVLLVAEAIAWNNAVPQGLSSSLWTRDVRNVGKWIGPAGSDTGIVNIGAAFGGNKSAGWGRESGGDAWKQYVRWSACTINFSDEAPLVSTLPHHRHDRTLYTHTDNNEKQWGRGLVTLRGRTVYKKERKRERKKKVIINHIYDLVYDAG
ncbi:NAD-aldehyde dehydrogenase [Lactarius hengduanensis]|nr:NAD-aldehyde dehydrogenase [Lactarius hengduanensis]